MSKETDTDGLAPYLKRFGSGWVEQRRVGNSTQVRLKQLEEFRGLVEQPGRFILLPGKELSGRFQSASIHLNGINLRERISPHRGRSAAETIQNDLEVVQAQS
jgi:hypothetical protein